MTTIEHAQLANALRFLSIDAVEKAKSGHPGLPMGMADVATVLFTRHLKVDPTNPTWPDRDRFVLSAGHGSAMLYASAHLLGYERMTLDEIKRFRQLGSLTPGHPEHNLSIGVEMTTGPLGQGLATAVGMAIAEQMLAARYTEDLVNHYTYVLASDGDMMEGISHEAASLAGHLRLSKLIVLYDDNGICIDGPARLAFSDNTLERFKSYGWNATSIDGHNPAEIDKAIAQARYSERPTLIACRTTIGYGAPTKGGTSGVHGSPLGTDEIEATRRNLNWPHLPFTIPSDILAVWRRAGQRNKDARLKWEKRLQSNPKHKQFQQDISGPLPQEILKAVRQFKQENSKKRDCIATRQGSGRVLDILSPIMPNLVGGSADLTPSNNTYPQNGKAITPLDFSGNYIHWGVREHGMAAAMNGIALHGGFIPYGGTFLCFSDYSRPALRLGAVMRTRTIHIMTHDSIGLGEDGPTHQPVEHLAALRAIPNLFVFRPADSIETAESWELALQHSGPSVLALSRQSLHTLRTTHTDDNLTARGGYVLAEAASGHPEDRKVTLVATGSEVSLALKARIQLETRLIPTAVVSMPCFELFSLQPPNYSETILGDEDKVVRIGVEAAVRNGWDRTIAPCGTFVGMSDFGASAPADQLYPHFGITVEAIVTSAIEKINVLNQINSKKQK